MKSHHYFAAGLVIAGLLIAFLVWRHTSRFPLVTQVIAGESISAGTVVYVDDEPAGVVARVEDGSSGEAELVIDRRALFSRLKEGLVRVSGKDDIRLYTDFCKAGARRLERGALVPSQTESAYLASKYLSPDRWPTWLWTSMAAVMAGVLFRRPLSRLLS